MRIGNRFFLREELYRLSLIALAFALTSYGHYLSLGLSPLLHELSQRGYYLPIAYAAYSYGPTGGVLAGLLSVALFLPHIGHHPEEQIQLNQYAELIVFLIIGLSVGLISKREKRDKERYRKAAEELRQANRELHEALNQLVHADRLTALGQISSGIVHEIRNPLASIRGALQTLEGDIDPQHPRREFFELILEELRRLDRISSDFLNYARPPRPRLHPIEPTQLLRSVASLITREAGRRGIQVQLRVSGSVPELSADEEQIKQVLLNLAINGLQAMRDGGLLKLAAEPCVGGVVLRVHDQGPGIPAELRKRLFEPFFTTKEGGTGLGLPIAHRLVQQHGGAIRTLDAPGGGSVFEVFLPLKAEGAGDAQSPPWPSPSIPQTT